MIECDWQKALSEDYGTKYHIGMCATGGSDDFVKVISMVPTLCWWLYDANNLSVNKDKSDGFVWKFGMFWHDRPVRMLRATVWEWIGNNKKFSRGTAAAIAAMSLLHVKTLYLVGFDDVVRGNMEEGNYHPTELRQYLKEQGKTLARSSVDHDWKNEGLVILKAASKYGTTVNFL
jgi:hypothetical protein